MHLDRTSGPCRNGHDGRTAPSAEKQRGRQRDPSLLRLGERSAPPDQNLVEAVIHVAVSGPLSPLHIIFGLSAKYF